MSATQRVHDAEEGGKEKAMHPGWVVVRFWCLAKNCKWLGETTHRQSRSGESREVRRLEVGRRCLPSHRNPPKMPGALGGAVWSTGHWTDGR